MRESGARTQTDEEKTMSQEALIGLMNDLSEDPQLRERLRDDPDSVLEGRDLTAEEIALVKEGDAAGIRKHLGKRAPAGFAKTAAGWIHKHTHE